MEKALGLRSCFNFVPEGSYHCGSEFRETLTRDGFEVGVHDLRHDGKLFRSRHMFERSAERINAYLSDWSAVGFRSGFMLRNLEWLHDLNIQYDSSTFDTDPFEPQPEGAGTIYPFWVNATATAPTASSSAAYRGGYLELPYTLPQDSTLFIVLRQRSPQIWLQKLDWIAAHGGMAMVTVHPDYISFNGSCRPHEYPIQYYSDFLGYIKKKYAEQCWNATPTEINTWCRAGCIERANPNCSKRPIAAALNP